MKIYSSIYPDWKTTQADVVKTIWSNEKWIAWVAELNALIVGLIVYEFYNKDKMGGTSKIQSFSEKTQVLYLAPLLNSMHLVFGGGWEGLIGQKSCCCMT